MALPHGAEPFLKQIERWPGAGSNRRHHDFQFDWRLSAGIHVVLNRPDSARFIARTARPVLPSVAPLAVEVAVVSLDSVLAKLPADSSLSEVERSRVAVARFGSVGTNFVDCNAAVIR